MTAAVRGEKYGIDKTIRIKALLFADTREALRGSTAQRLWTQQY
jgi:hypothetical protein